MKNPYPPGSDSYLWWKATHSHKKKKTKKKKGKRSPLRKLREVKVSHCI